MSGVKQFIRVRCGDTVFQREKEEKTNKNQHFEKCNGFTTLRNALLHWWLSLVVVAFEFLLRSFKQLTIFVMFPPGRKRKAEASAMFIRPKTTNGLFDRCRFHRHCAGFICRFRSSLVQSALSSIIALKLRCGIIKNVSFLRF